MEKISPTIAFKLLLLVGLMFCIPLISAQPSTTIYSFPQGYTIVPIEYEQLKVGEDFAFFFYLKNTSSGLLIDNTTAECNFYMADSQGNLVIYQQEVFQPNGFWTTNISGSNVSQTGYYYFGVDCEDGNGGSLAGVFEVTLNGKASPEGIVIAVFVLAFILVFALSILSFMKSLGNTLEMKMDLLDATFMMVTYLGVWMFYYFSIEYLANPFVNDILELMISVGWITHIFLPLVGFAVSYIMTTLKFNQKARITY